MRGEHGLQPALVLYDLCDDDKDSFWAVGMDAKGATEAMVQYGVGSIYSNRVILAKSLLQNQIRSRALLH